MRKKIYTIEELQKEKEKLRVTIDVTRDAFVESLGTNRKLAIRFLLENIAIPAGVLGLGTFAVKQFSHSDDLKSSEEIKREKVKSKKSKFKWLLKQVFPFAMNMVQAFLLQKQNEKMREYLSDEFDESDETTEKSINIQLKSVS